MTSQRPGAGRPSRRSVRPPGALVPGLVLAFALAASSWPGPLPAQGDGGDQLALDRDRTPARIEPVEIPPPTFRKPQFRRGDTNADGEVNISDAVAGLEFLFKQGPRPPCMEAANSNGDIQLDISDAVFSLNFLFLGTVPPPPPGPEECGVDPREDNLGCGEYPPCPDELPLITHVLSRITFGPTLELLERIQTRADLIDYIEEQLDAPDDYDVTVHEPELAAAIDTLDIGFRSPWYDTTRGQVQRLKAMLIVNALRSRWQLLHVVTQFWNNHFHTQIDTLRQNFFGRGGRGGGAMRTSAEIFNAADADSSGVLTEEEWNTFRETYPTAIPWDRFNRSRLDGLTLQEFLDHSQIAYWKYGGGIGQQGISAEMERREYDVYRSLAFGRFKDLLESCAKSVAMLIYLNGYENTVLSPNENFGREYLELFGIGVDHVYTQRDIEEIAKVFTGWTADWVRRSDFDPSDRNFQGNPGAPSFAINTRMQAPRFRFPTGANWDDDVYTWAFVLGQRRVRRFRNPLDAHDWGRKDIFLPRYGGVDSLGNPVDPADAVAIPANDADHTVSAALREFDLVHEQLVSFRDCAKFISTKLIQLLVTDDLSRLAKTRAMPEDLAAKFAAVDADGDGSLSLEEWETPIPLVLPNGRPPSIFQSLDADGDGVITRIEYQEPDLLLDAIDAWRSSGGTIRDVLRAILFSDEFLSLKFYRAKVKTPFEVVTSTMRGLGATASYSLLARTVGDIALAGMELFNFADPTGESELHFDWMHTVGLLERLKFVNRGANPTSGAEARFTWKPGTFASKWDLRSAERTVDFFSLLLLGGDVRPEHRALAIAAYNGAPANRRINAAVAFLLSLPEFQKQ